MFILLVLSLPAAGQKMVAEKSKISFFSKAAVEDISAVNVKTQSILNTGTNELVFIVPIQEFDFERGLMKEHFNEKYMETEKFPKATFQGKIEGFDPKGSGEQHAVAKGKMTIHGVVKELEIPGTIEVTANGLALNTKFFIKLADFNITIPTMFFKHIAEQVEVTAEFTYKPQ